MTAQTAIPENLPQKLNHYALPHHSLQFVMAHVKITTSYHYVITVGERGRVRDGRVFPYVAHYLSTGEFYSSKSPTG